MPAKVVPTDSQVEQLNLDRLRAIFKLPQNYLVKIIRSSDIFLENDDSLWNVTYKINVGKSPIQVTIPAHNKPGWFCKSPPKTVTRYTRIARIHITPSYAPGRSVIQLTGNESENKLIAAMIDKASRDWIFERGKTKDITLNINVFPESEKEYFDIE